MILRSVLPSAVAALVLAVGAAFVIQDAGKEGRPEYRDFLTRIEKKPGSVTFYSQDLVWHFNYCKSIWKQRGQRPYTEAYHLEFARAWLGEIPPGVWAFGYSPVLPFLARPFLHVEARTLYIAVLLANAAILATLLRTAMGSDFRTRFFLVSIASISSLYVVRYGQLTFLFMGALWLAWRLTDELRSRGGGWRTGVLGMVIFFLAVKPNYALVFAVALLMAGAWRPVLWGGGAALAACLYMTPYMGGWPQWLQDYGNLVSNYTPDRIAPSRAWCMDPLMNTNLVSPLVQAGWLPPVILSRLSSCLWLLGLGVLTAGAHTFWKRERPFCFQLNLLLFLLLSPHLMHYEDALLGLLFVSGTPEIGRRKQWALLFLAFITVNFDQRDGLLAATVWGGWTLPSFAKAGIFLLLLVEKWPRSREHHPD
jgi:hypothetical protein